MTRRLRLATALALFSAAVLLASVALAAPRIIVISLDGATPRLAAGAAALSEGQPGRALDHDKRAWATAQPATKR
jgi:hypothetical protein